MCRFIPTRVGNMSSIYFFSSARSVHPHTCGEHKSRGLGGFLSRGSSPHVWGTLSKTAYHLHRARFIPTRVGNMMPMAPGITGSSVHPHTCGEHLPVPTSEKLPDGSSPHVWGTSGHQYQTGPSPRFIPTRVGNIRETADGSDQTPVHPHTCGEHRGSIFLELKPCGSSPHVWGT